MNGLSEAQLEHFRRDGFLAVPGVLSDDDLAPMTAEYERLLDYRLGRLVGDGRLETRPAGNFTHRFLAGLRVDPEFHRYFNISLPLVNGSVDSGAYEVHTGPAVFDLLRHPRILDVVESVIGPEILSNPVQQMRIKPPVAGVDGDLKVHSNVGSTTWHQDIVALLPEADDTPIVTVWVALSDADETNGCLVSIPGSHRLGPRIHCANAELASEPNVPAAALAGMKQQPLPMARGGIILFDKLNVHCSLPNRSSAIRWSMDLRYSPVGHPTGRPAFPGFVARSRSHPESELRDWALWRAAWSEARERILRGDHGDRIFEDTRWNDAAVC